MALHVVESTFCCGFDSFRAHHSFQEVAANQARTEAFGNSIEKARFSALGIKWYGTFTARSKEQALCATLADTGVVCRPTLIHRRIAVLILFEL